MMNDAMKEMTMGDSTNFHAKIKGEIMGEYLGHLRFADKMAAKEWRVANLAAVNELEDYAMNLPETLFIDVNLYRPGSTAPAHIQAFDHDLMPYASIPVRHAAPAPASLA